MKSYRLPSVEVESLVEEPHGFRAQLSLRGRLLAASPRAAWAHWASSHCQIQSQGSRQRIQRDGQRKSWRQGKKRRKVGLGRWGHLFYTKKHRKSKFCCPNMSKKAHVFFFFFSFSPTAKLAMGSLAQNSSGAIRCSCNTRFRRRFRRVPEPSGADG